MRRIEGGAALAWPPAASVPPATSEPPSRSGPPGSAPRSASASPAVSPEKQFGLAPVERPPPRRITARVASAARQRSGRYVITLDDGEVWVQTDDQLGFAPHEGSSVSIKRGLLGSYWLRDKYYAVAVRRVR